MDDGIHIMIYDEDALTPDEAFLTEAERAQLKTLGYTRRRWAEWIRGRLAVRHALATLQGNRFDKATPPRYEKLHQHGDSKQKTHPAPAGRPSGGGDFFGPYGDKSPLERGAERSEAGCVNQPSSKLLFENVTALGGCDVLSAPDGAPYVTGGLDYAVSLSHDGAYVAVALAQGRGRRIGVDLCLRAHTARVRRILDRLGVEASPIDPVAQWAALECVIKLRRRSVTTLFDAALSLERRAEALVVRGLGAPALVHPSAYENFVVCTGAS